jgi:hypothetical protein
MELAGHEVYLVGGSVRDMLLKQVPKDFDVITTAQLKQVIHALAFNMRIKQVFSIDIIFIYMAGETCISSCIYCWKAFSSLSCSY